MFLGALPIYLFTHFWRMMYRWATMHGVTNRRTDSHTDRQTTLWCQ